MWWLAGVGLGLLVVILVGAGLVLIARRLPPGPAKEMVAFGPNCVVLLRRLRKDRRLHIKGRLALGAALAYLLSPVQIIPNFIPIIGQSDDFLVLMAALRYACRHLPRDEVEAAWPGDPRYLNRLLGAPVQKGSEDAATSGINTGNPPQ